MTGIQKGTGNPHDCDRGFFFPHSVDSVGAQTGITKQSKA